MALILTVAALKGGVGKSTVSVNLASCLHKAGHRALIVDADPQGTCRMWAARAAESGHEGPPVVSMEGHALRRDLANVMQGFDAVVIDTPARMGVEARASMMVADLVLMPTIPGGADVWALRETLDVLADARGIRPELRAGVVFNRADRTTLAAITRKALDNLEVPVFGPVLSNRVVFGEATLSGLSVLDYAPQSPAAREVAELTQAIIEAAGEAGDGDVQAAQG